MSMIAFPLFFDDLVHRASCLVCNARRTSVCWATSVMCHPAQVQHRSHWLSRSSRGSKSLRWEVSMPSMMLSSLHTVWFVNFLVFLYMKSNFLLWLLLQGRVKQVCSYIIYCILYYIYTEKHFIHWFWYVCKNKFIFLHLPFGYYWKV